MRKPPPTAKRDLSQAREFAAPFAVLLGLGLVLAYSGSFKLGFYFDDVYGIVDNPAIRSLRNIPGFFTDPHAVWTEQTQADLRPVLLASYAINYAISGLNPWSYHALNLVLHFVAALLVFFIARDFLWPASARGAWEDSSIPAAAAALFFAFAPLNTQPVNYIWARSALLCTTLYLGAFLAYLRLRWRAGSALFVLALLTKAVAVTLPAVLLAYDFIYRDRKRCPTLAAYCADAKRRLLPIGLPALLSLLYLAYRFAVLPFSVGARIDVGVTPRIWFMSQWPALLYYARLFAWPAGLSVDHGFPYTTSFFSPRACLSLLGLLAWIAMAFREAGRRPWIAFATAWFFITLMPESSFAPLAEVVNDHRPYIASSLGLSVLLAGLLEWGAASFGARKCRVFAVASAALCLAALPVIRRRNRDWRDPLSLWESAIRASPNNGRAWMNAGLCYMRAGRLAQARRYFEKTRELSPQYVYLPINMSILERSEGRLDAALREAQEAVRLQPDLGVAYFYLGKALEESGREGPAADAYRRAVEFDPRDAEARASLARLEQGPDESDLWMKEGLKALYERHDPLGAQALFRKVLQRKPAHYGATFQLATALDQAGEGSKARPLWEKVLEMAEGYGDERTAERARSRLKGRP